ncbi:ATP-binding cassette subfamily F protein 3 [Stella humosa]|uniref:ATP-binding cassette subfamily F protein 3 n=1 Tax=Stella humosa TaxID=94 RepID=A0A3N1MC88_9PROT|nr:ABC-F family ATP-binding cassette domain-containing protein [Stella humosa]ROQ01333.1 ATP-binding cassette subfamily F protein 3 [Stella humosa]BBK31707.1 glycosyl transferase family 1 [Stella humosa]
MIEIRAMTYRIAGRVLFDGADATIPDGYRVGIVGPNGTGKSTLFDLLLNHIQPDGGSIGIRPGARVGFVAQEAPEGETTPLEAVLAADTERERLLAALETAAPEDLADIHLHLQAIGAQSAPSRAASILDGLGFDAEAQARPLASFSGGWRMRVALAAALFAEPDLLLLDEPTNHLDLEATMWLEGHLARYPHTLLVISHDRALLNTAVNQILHLAQRRLTLYGGNYDTFERLRAERRAHEAAFTRTIEAQRKHMQAFVDRFRFKASKARQAQSRLKAIAKLPPPAAVAEDPHVVFNFPTPVELAPPIISCDEVSVGYGGRAVLKRLDLRVDPDDRIGLLGANGNGKSTLAKLFAGALEPMSGRITRSAKLSVGFFAQHQLDALDAESTAAEQMARAMPHLREPAIRAYLGRFGLTQQKADVKAKDLSGGEKARLALAQVCRVAPSLLILDEPTNHLDIDARAALVAALNDYPGAVVMVSHDWSLLEATVDRLLLVADGMVKPFDGDLDDYRRLLLNRQKAAAQSEGPSESERKVLRREAAGKRQAAAPLRKKVQAAAVAVDRLEKERAAVEKRLADPATYAKDAASVPDLLKSKADLDRRVAAAEADWMEAEEALAAAMADA